MRYRHTGNVHKDFHLATDTTIRYVLDRYGSEFLRGLFRRTSQRVYRRIHERLMEGDSSALLEHWKHYDDREAGTYRVSEEEDRIVFLVTDCPAARHLHDRGVAVTDDFHLQTSLLNDGLSEDTPFEIRTELLGGGSYRMTVLRR